MKILSFFPAETLLRPDVVNSFFTALKDRKKLTATEEPDGRLLIVGGSEPYYADAQTCTCRDFIFTKRSAAPCKHVFYYHLLREDLTEAGFLDLIEDEMKLALDRCTSEQLKYFRDFLLTGKSAILSERPVDLIPLFGALPIFAEEQKKLPEYAIDLHDSAAPVCSAIQTSPEMLKRLRDPLLNYVEAVLADE